MPRGGAERFLIAILLRVPSRVAWYGGCRNELRVCGCVGVADMHTGTLGADKVDGHTKENENKEISSSLKGIFSLSRKEDKEEKSSFF